MEGTTVHMPVDPAVAAAAARPRHRRHAPARGWRSPTAAGPTAFTAQAELIEPMGAETLIHARTVNGDDIRVVLPRERRVAVGETLHLVPEAGQTHVFDADGEAVRT